MTNLKRKALRWLVHYILHDLLKQKTVTFYPGI